MWLELPKYVMNIMDLVQNWNIIRHDEIWQQKHSDWPPNKKVLAKSFTLFFGYHSLIAYVEKFSQIPSVKIRKSNIYLYQKWIKDNPNETFFNKPLNFLY
jgi:hypothetical protein